MSIDCEDYISSSDSNFTYPNFVEYARITFGDKNSYSMKTETITIGRNSTDGNVDIDVGPQTFVSRKHLEVSYSFQRLQMKCLGKNGIFIDNYFKEHSSIAYELPHECTLRFPSTNVEVMVQQLAGRCIKYKQINAGQFKRSINISDNYGYFNEEEDMKGADLYVSRLVENNKPASTDSEECKDMEIFNKCTPKRSMSTTDMQQCSVRVQNIKIDKRIIINPGSYRSYSYSHDFIYGQNGQIFGTNLDPKDLAIDYGTETQKPPYSYAQLIVQAVSTCPDRQLTLNGIYNYISKHYPYFKCHDKGWQNSVRHNLSLNRYFIKIPRAQDEPGKGSFWRIDGAYESKLISQSFRKRRLRSGGGGGGGGQSVCGANDGLATGSRVYSVTGAARTTSSSSGNICSLSDYNTRLSTFYTVKTNQHKTAFVLKKMNETKAVSQNIISVVNGTNQSSFNVDKKIRIISPNTVFQNTQTTKSVHKRLYPSTIHVINDSNTSSSSSTQETLYNIDGNLYSASNEVKSLQVISSNKDSVSFIPMAAKSQSNNKYILISSSKTQSIKSSSPAPPSSSVFITGSGSLYQSVAHLNSQSSAEDSQQQSAPLTKVIPFKSHKSTSPSQDFNHDIPSQLCLDNTPHSPNLKYPRSMDPDDYDDDLDFEMDQFLVSSPIMDNSGDLDTSSDLYNVDDDDAMWHDSLGFHDVEIEGH